MEKSEKRKSGWILVLAIAVMLLFIYTIFMSTGCGGGSSGGGEESASLITIKGRVVDADDNPIVGAKITFFDELDNLVAETTTNSDGYFEVSLEGGRTYSYKIAGEEYSTVNVGGNGVDLGTLDFDHVGVITAIIVLEDNPLNPSGLEGTKVEIEGTNINGTTDSSGYVAVINVPSNTSAQTGYSVIISRDGYVSQTITGVQVKNKKETNLNLFDSQGNELGDGITREIKLLLSPMTPVAKWELPTKFPFGLVYTGSEWKLGDFDSTNLISLNDNFVQISSINITTRIADLCYSNQIGLWGIDWNNNIIKIVNGSISETHSTGLSFVQGICHNGNNFFIGGKYDKTIHRLDSSFVIDLTKVINHSITGMAFNPDDNQFAICSWDEDKIYVLNDQLEIIGEYAFNPGQPQSITYLSGYYYVTSGDDGFVYKIKK